MNGDCKTLSITLLSDQKRAYSVPKLAHLILTVDSQIKKPLIRTEGKTLYYSVPASLEEQTRPNLKRKLDEFLADGEEVVVSDPAFAIDFKYKVRFR